MVEDDGREAKFGVAIGDIGMGKSEATLKQAIRYAQRGQKYLIGDLQREYGGYKLKSLPGPPIVNIPIISHKPEAIMEFTARSGPQMARVIFDNDDHTPMDPEQLGDAIYEILKYYKDGGFLIEDINVFVGNHYRQDIMGRIISQRHFSCDIVTHYQGVTRLKNQTIWSRINWIRYHKCFDSVEMCRKEFGGHYELMKLAETLVNMQYDADPNGEGKRFHCYVYRHERKIKGELVTQDMFLAAIERYLNKNYKRAMSEYLEERDGDGKAVYDPTTAYRVARQRLFDTYYGNPD